MSLIDSLKKDIHYIESLNSCMNCGVCTAICPSAEFYNYDPRIIADTVQRQDEESIEGLLKSDTIWYCGECMSCKTRCPRCNTPGGIIMALRRLSQEKGWFTESEKGRQQFALKRILGNNILNYGYCVTPDIVKCIRNKVLSGNGFMNTATRYTNEHIRITNKREPAP